MAEQRIVVEVDGRTLSLSNLDKVLYPTTGTTKAEVIDYYTRIAAAALPHIAERPLTRKRWPDGVHNASFFEKNAPRGMPEWVRTVTLPSPGSSRDRETVTYVVCDDLPTLVWLANLAVIELHVPQWKVDRRGRPLQPDRLVLDLDPGPPATIIECARVALLLHDALQDDGLVAHPKTSGNKGMQLYVGLDGKAAAEDVHGYARHLAEHLERDRGDLVVSRMDKRLRRGKVLVDWSQNSAAKTTVAPWSLRGRDEPTVSTPVTWEEVEAAAGSRARTRLPLRFTHAQALDRFQSDGDLFEPLLREAFPLPPARARSRP